MRQNLCKGWGIVGVVALMLGSLPAPAGSATQAPSALHFSSVEVDDAREQPRACLVFDSALASDAPGEVAGSVSITPAGSYATVIEDAKLCVEGLAFGQSYEVTVKPGLKAAGEDVSALAAPVTRRLSIPDRKPTLAFKSAGLVLPTRGGEGLPVRTMNVHQAKVRILRVNDRNLVRAVAERMVRENLSSYTLNDLADGDGEKVYEGTLEIESRKNAWVTTALPVRTALGLTKPGVYVATAAPVKEHGDKAGENASPSGSNNTEDDAPWEDLATQWFIISDMGLSAFKAEDGLLVVARSLEDSQPLPDVSLSLYSRSNTLLGTATTDSKGKATFPGGLLRGRGSQEPALLMASSPAKQGDFSFLDLSQQRALDLTDRGDTGRTSEGVLDAYVVTERGVYRPGETVHATFLIRDRAFNVPENTPFTVYLVRPDDVRSETRQLANGKAGGFTVDFPLAETAMSGTWWVEVKADPAQPPVGVERFQVEDFQPPRLEFSLKPEKTAIGADGVAHVGLEARFLYGAPAAGLNAKSNVELRVAETPFPDLKGYHFGLIEEEHLPASVEQADVTTDEDGRTTVDVALGPLPDTTRPLEAALVTDVFDVGGRPVTEQAVIPVRHLPLTLGVRVPDGGVKANSVAPLEVVALDAEGRRVARQGLTWTLYKEEYDYVWALINGQWRYDPLVTAVRVTGGKLDVSADAPARLEVPVEDGYYRFDVRDAQHRFVASSARFTAGWWVNPDTVDQPDTVAVTRNTAEPVTPGQNITVHVAPPYASETTVLAATHTLGSPQLVSVPAQGADVNITVPEGLTGGFYVLVSAVQVPSASPQKAGPLRRAMGLLWVPVDPRPHQLKVQIDAPERARPLQKVETTVHVEGVPEGAPAYVTLAAVDDGVLQMTDYASPHPENWFLGQQVLGVTPFDLYGDLIDASGALKGVLRQGGDGTGTNRQMKGLPRQITKVVSLFSGIVTVEKGVATLPLTLPDFNGRLRLMAMAWTADRVGQSERMMTVRAPLVAEVLFPRFMAPQDTASIVVDMDNREAPAGTYHLALKGAGPATVSFETATSNGPAGARAPEGKRAAGADVTLAPGQRKAVPLTLSATAIGTATFTLTLTGPEGFSLVRTFPLSVRAGQATLTTRTRAVVKAGETVSIPPAEGGLAFVQGTGESTLTLSPTPEIDVPFLLKDLMRYPYGCVEQTVSTALPLLYLSSVAASLNLGPEQDLQAKIRYAVAKLADLQRTDGGFSLWGNREEEQNLWVSAYVADFLTRAAQQNVPVPTLLRTALLKRLLQDADAFSGEAKEITGVAYAHYVLAKNGHSPVSTLRQFFDTYGEKLPSRLARAQIAAALKQVGDEERMRLALSLLDSPAPSPVSRPGDQEPSSLKTTKEPAHDGKGEEEKKEKGKEKEEEEEEEEEDVAVYDYGTPLRDQAASLTLLAEEKLVDSARLLKEAADLQSPVRTSPVWRFYSTQEEAWLLLAAHALRSLPDSGRTMPVQIGKESIESATALHRTLSPTQTVDVTNKGQADIFQTVTRAGVPTEPQPTEAKGFTLTRAYYRPDGTALTDLSAVPQNALLVVVLTGQTEDSYPQSVLVNDMLPAGFEIENVRLTGADRLDSMSWLGEELSTPVTTENRADRFVASLNLGNWWNARTFKLAYMVRAVTPGRFFHPGATVEDMYRPARFARTGSGLVRVTQPASAADKVAPVTDADAPVVKPVSGAIPSAPAQPTPSSATGVR